jgi:hypothetical protein
MVDIIPYLNFKDVSDCSIPNRHQQCNVCDGQFTISVPVEHDKQAHACGASVIDHLVQSCIKCGKQDDVELLIACASGLHMVQCAPSMW